MTVLSYEFCKLVRFSVFRIQTHLHISPWYQINYPVKSYCILVRLQNFRAQGLFGHDFVQTLSHGGRCWKTRKVAWVTQLSCIRAPSLDILLEHEEGHCFVNSHTSSRQGKCQFTVPGHLSAPWRLFETRSGLERHF